MDGILLPVKGQAAKNLARTLELPSFPKIMSKEEEEKLFAIWEENERIREQRLEAMEKELCFILDGEFIYLEQSLIDFNEIPIFFLCKDRNSHFYIALCTDFESFDYLVMKVSVAEVKDLLHQRVTMREIITKQDTFWKVETREKIELDKVEYLPMERVDYSVLPEEGAFFKVLTEEMRKFVKRFDELELS